MGNSRLIELQSGAGYSKRRQLSTQIFAPDIIFIYLEMLIDKYYRKI